MRAMISGFTLFVMSSPLFAVGAPLNEAECLEKAKTALERVYCQVRARGEGESLPNLETFRKNSEIAQKELLWSPARRLGLDLPGVRKQPDYRARALPMGIRYAPPDPEVTAAQARAKLAVHSGPLRASTGANAQESVQSQIVVEGSSSAATMQASMQANAHSVPAVQQEAAVSTAVQASAPAVTSSVAAPATSAATASASAAKSTVASAQSRGSTCALRGVQIDCGSTYYQLLVNRPKHALAETALTQSNRLELPPFGGDIRDESAVRAYLNTAYEAYIHKMIDLGLAGSTMSFTTFYYSFKDQTERNVDFAGRFEAMFEFLKADRQRLAVSTATPSELPQSLGQCATLTQEIIVCDNHKKNWVYVRREML